MAGDEAARSDIFERLGMRDVSVFRSPSLRSELSIRVHIDPFKSTRYGEAMAHSLGWLIAALQKEPEFTLVLVSTTKLCENVCNLLRDYEVSADCFHAQMAEEDKKVAQSNFEEAKVLVFVATMGSFGMGVHSSKPIKHVVHYGAPQSLEDYYNEVGRAGRDGAHARCTLILTSEDITKYSGGMWTKDKDAQQQEQQLDAIRGVREFALNCEKCRWQSLTERLDDGAVVDPCGMCDVCCAPLAAPPKAEFGSIFAFLIRLVYEATRKGESYTPQTWRELWVFARSSTALRAEESKLPAAVRTSGPRAGKMLGACLSFLLAPQGLVDISLRAPSNYGRGWGQGYEQFALSEAGLALYKTGLAGLSYRAPLPPMLYFLPPGHECGSTRPAGSLLEVAAEAERPSPRLRGRRTACAASCGCPLADGAIECSGCVTWFHPVSIPSALCHPTSPQPRRAAARAGLPREGGGSEAAPRRQRVQAQVPLRELQGARHQLCRARRWQACGQNGDGGCGGAAGRRERGDRRRPRVRGRRRARRLPAKCQLGAGEDVPHHGGRGLVGESHHRMAPEIVGREADAPPPVF